jgi:Subunit ChlI of Mg-chelatase
MVQRVATVAFEGIEARAVDVQVQVAAGLPAFIVVGLPDKSVTEARQRVRSALIASGLALPARRITVNLAPADLPKEGSHEGKKIVAQLNASRDRLMRLGELAAGVEKQYNEEKLKQFAKDIGIPFCTLARCRSVYRAWQGKEAPAPKSYAVAQELQAHPEEAGLAAEGDQALV